MVRLFVRHGAGNGFRVGAISQMDGRIKELFMADGVAVLRREDFA